MVLANGPDPRLFRRHHRVKRFRRWDCFRSRFRRYLRPRGWRLPDWNETDTTTGYTLNELQITEMPLGTGSFTQLAILSPGVSADLLNTAGTNAGLGNQAIWANGQRDTSRED